MPKSASSTSAKKRMEAKEVVESDVEDDDSVGDEVTGSALDSSDGEDDENYEPERKKKVISQNLLLTKNL